MRLGTAVHRSIAERSSDGDWSTSLIGRPTADSNGTPVMASAARLKSDALCAIGRRQAARQAVDDMLVQRLQIRDRRGGLLETGRSAERSRLASDPLRSAAAKNPNRLRATVYWATERGGRTIDSSTSDG